MGPHQRYSAALLLAPLASTGVITGCHADGSALVGGTTEATTGTGVTSVADSTSGTNAGTSGATSSGSSADTTAGPIGPTGDPAVCAAIAETEVCGEPGAVPNGPYEVTEVELPVTLDPTDACPCLEENRALDFEVWAPGGWPAAPTTAPLVLFAHGNGFSFSSYPEVIEIFVSMGFVAANVDLDANGGWSDYADDMRCAAEALKATFGDALRCELVLAGHSQGGTAAFSVAAEIDQGSSASIFHPFDLRGLVLLAPAAGQGEPTFSPSNAVPTLIFGSTTDGQVSGAAGQLYDMLGRESESAEFDAGRTVIWVDGTVHGSFAGAEPALAAMQGYLPEFLRSQVFTGSDATWWSYATTQEWPPEVLDDALWSDLETYSLHADDDCSALLGSCETTPGCAAAPGGGDCIDEPRIKTMFTPPSDYRHAVEHFEQRDAADIDDDPSNMTIEVDNSVTIFFDDEFHGARGVESRILRLDYGDPLGLVGEITIPVPQGISVGDMTHLAMRTGNVVDMVLADTCEAESDEPVRFDVRLGRGGAELSVPLSTGRLPQQYHHAPSEIYCDPVQAMQTVRFNVGEWCEFGTDEIDRIVLTFDEPVDPARVIIDTIEFTDYPLDEVDNLPVCGVVGEGGMWACEVDALAVSETSCSSEPTGSPVACDSGDIETNPVDPPVAAVPGDTFPGWAVHTRPGMVFDVLDPSAGELAFVRERCVEACELEYADRPEIAADCADPDAFFEPTLITQDSHASHFQIPETMVNGGGAFDGESLDCDLRTDCCEAFDEDLCPTRPLRVTEARQGLERGEEWHYGVEGVLIIDSPSMEEPVMGDIVGSMGGSLCSGGNASAPCPIYIGSAEVELVDPLTIALQCGAQTVTHELEDLDLTLAQPAFGIQSHAYPVWSAFPDASLVFDAHTVVDGLTFDTFLPSEECTSMLFNAGWASVPLYGQFSVTIDVPCGGDLVEVEAWFGLTATSWQGSPPSGMITVPNSVSCPSTQALSVTASDAENDIVSVRWQVDGVLLEEGTSTMAFTQPHTVTAILRDTRGATQTLTKFVDCS